MKYTTSFRKNWKTLLLALALCGGSIYSQAADANPPARMTYQGFLVDGNGVPLGNANVQNFDVVFRIYSVSQGGVSLWSEQQTVEMSALALLRKPPPTTEAKLVV